MFLLRLLKELSENASKVTFKKEISAVSNDYRINLIFDETILPYIKDCERDSKVKTYKEMTKQILKSFLKVINSKWGTENV